MDKILSLLTKENITFLIAVLGFLLSLYNFLRDILQNRMKLHVIYKNHLISEHDHKGISISRIFLNIDDISLEFYWIPQFVFQATQKCKGEILDEINVHTIPLPAHIEGYGIIGGFFFVKAPYLLAMRNCFLQKLQ